MSGSPTQRLLLAFGWSAVFACTTVEPEPEAAPLQFASDEESIRILQTITAIHWNPLTKSNRSGLLCCPMTEDQWGNSSFLDSFKGPHEGHCAIWRSIPESLMARLQEHAALIYLRSDQTSGKLLFRASWQNLGSMRKLFYSRPVLHDSGLTATICLSVDTGFNSAEHGCYHLDLQQDGTWSVNGKFFSTAIIN